MSVRGVFLIGFLGLSALIVASRRTADIGERTIQVVYESDTRGYYLPCG